MAGDATHYRLPLVPDVLTIGNALVDVLAHADDGLLARLDLVKGSMNLVDADRSAEVYKAMGPGIEVSGGCAANTATGIVSFGGSAAFIGKVCDDQFGDVYRHDLKSVGVEIHVEAHGAGAGVATGSSIIMVTPDGERTMNTHLGIAAQVSVDDVDPAVVASAGLVYVEGYLWDIESTKDAIRKTIGSLAPGARFAFTMSDSFCVERHAEEFRALADESIDVLFANETEILALYGVASFDDALVPLRGRRGISFVTRGAAGSVVVAGDEVHTVAADPVDAVVDATGAGDLYASGALYGLARGADLATCARLGSLAAAEIISHLGARPQTSLRALADAAGLP
jgi:sugar/nucleoside kinase (ribokinase family)